MVRLLLLFGEEWMFKGGGQKHCGGPLLLPPHLGVFAELLWHGAGAAVSMVTSHFSSTSFTQFYPALIQTDAKQNHLRKYTVSPFSLLCLLLKKTLIW